MTRAIGAGLGHSMGDGFLPDNSPALKRFIALTARTHTSLGHRPRVPSENINKR
jgi:hypothetical protein